MKRIILFSLGLVVCVSALVMIVTSDNSAANKNAAAANDKLAKYFIARFLEAREGFDSGRIDIDSDTVRLLTESQQYREYWSTTVNMRNADSLMNTLGSAKKRRVDVLLIQLTDADRAQVRFRVTETSVNGSQEAASHIYDGGVRFAFKDLNLSETDSLVNPLGFRVSEYHAEQSK